MEQEQQTGIYFEKGRHLFPIYVNKGKKSLVGICAEIPSIFTVFCQFV